MSKLITANPATFLSRLSFNYASCLCAGNENSSVAKVHERDDNSVRWHDFRLADSGKKHGDELYTEFGFRVASGEDQCCVSDGFRHTHPPLAKKVSVSFTNWLVRLTVRLFVSSLRCLRCLTSLNTVNIYYVDTSIECIKRKSTAIHLAKVINFLNTLVESIQVFRATISLKRHYAKFGAKSAANIFQIP
jgi:hypothetical protein